MRFDSTLLRPLTALTLALGLAACAADADGDGSPEGVDCDDADATVFPGATEVPGDGVDSNCDGSDNPLAGDDDDTGDRTDPGEFDSAEAVTGDWSCKGTLGEVFAGGTAELIGTVEDFQDEIPVAGAHVRIWADNDPTGSAADAFEPDLTDVNGEFAVPAGEINACEPFAARVWTEFDPPETYQTFQINIIVAGDAPFRETFNSVAYSTYQLLPLTVGVEPLPGQGIAAGRVRDCADIPVANAEASVGSIDFDTGVVTEAPDYAMRYFEDESPEQDQLWTSEDGLFGGMNVPPGQWDLLVWGIPQDEAHCDTTTDGATIIRPTQNEDYCLLGSTALTVQPDSVNISNVYLQQYPPSCYEPPAVGR